MDLLAITGALAGANNALTILRTAASTSDRLKINEAISALSDKLLNATTSALTLQQEKAALDDEVRQLKQRIADLQKLETDKQNYKLTDLGSGAMVYAFKPLAESDEPPHWLCVPCLNKGQKSVLQYAGRIGNDRGVDAKHECPACRSAVIAYYGRRPGAETPKPAE